MDKTTETLARYATDLRYESLSGEAIHAARRRLIDSFACALGGYTSPPSQIARRLAGTASAKPSARVLVDGTQTSPETAAFANTVMVRYLDANDTYQGKNGSGGHPSDMLGALLAAGEASGATGTDLLLAMAVGYEVYASMADEVALSDIGWDQGTFIAPGAAAGAGRLLGLTFEQMAEALAIVVTANLPTRQTRAGELSMWKGVATAHSARAALFAVQLAKEGMTGPTAALEGHHGLFQQVTGPIKLASLGGRPSALERGNFKYFAAEAHSQAPIWLAFSVREKTKLEDIQALNVRTYQFAYDEIGSGAAKWDPQTRETADHSLPYILACALRDGRISPETFEPARYLDPAVRPLMNKISVTVDADFRREDLRSEIEVVTASGGRYVERSTLPKGHAQNPMTDADIEQKFRDLSAAVLPPERADAALKALWQTETLPSVSAVIDLLAKP
jgi:2-methylcitrate dehydratase